MGAVREYPILHRSMFVAELIKLVNSVVLTLKPHDFHLLACTCNLSIPNPTGD